MRDLKIPHAKSKAADFVTLSIGVASFTPSMQDIFMDLIKVVDKVLYQCKHHGRNQVICR
ncbi:MAG: diguanylate cyclase [Magnetococcales bacterium]|nr:diguanylate cyclase [Magnetococcales bacterium]NGZ28533.1 diguanylate cyclase [Magnetococcales bacterium]